MLKCCLFVAVYMGAFWIIGHLLQEWMCRMMQPPRVQDFGCLSDKLLAAIIENGFDKDGKRTETAKIAVKELARRSALAN